jgi:hypothetical protein
MPELDFQIEQAKAVAYAVAPQLAFKLRITQAADAGDDAGEPLRSIHTVVLRCQIRIEPTRRQYLPAEQEQLQDLFGEPDRWGQTLRGMLWTHVSAVVPAFTESIVVDLPVPCTYDFNVATTKYFGALEAGDIPLCFLFSGTIFYEAEDGSLQIAQIPWEKEANFRLPVLVWKQMMELYYPNTAWLCLRKDVFDQLRQFKTRLAIPTWEQAMERLLSEAQEGIAP